MLLLAVMGAQENFRVQRDTISEDQVGDMQLGRRAPSCLLFLLGQLPRSIGLGPWVVQEAGLDGPPWV